MATKLNTTVHLLYGKELMKTALNFFLKNQSTVIPRGRLVTSLSTCNLETDKWTEFDTINIKPRINV